MTGIREMFRELDGYERYELDLARLCSFRESRNAEWRADPWNRKRAVQAAKKWRKANPDRSRDIQREVTRKWRKSNPEKYRAQKKRYNDNHREQMREVWKRNQAARRARLKAAATIGGAS